MRAWAAGCLLLASCAPNPPPVTVRSPPASAPARPSSPVAAASKAAPAETPASSEGVYEDAHDDPVADDVELEDLPAPPAAADQPHPLDGVGERTIAERLASDAVSLGSMSIGRPSAGALFNGVRMPEGDEWVLVDPHNAWGTRETVDYLQAAIRAVYARLPGTHPLYIGHISAKRGGPLSPHVSHQAGRDVDISYFYQDESSARWYARAHAGNLDRARTWSFVRALVTHTDVELILIDHSIQRLLQEHALAIGEDPEWVNGLFRGKPGVYRPLIVHAKGHATHLHVRFYNPIAQETARRCHTALIERGLVDPPVHYVKHRVRKGETLGMLARKYKSTVGAIRSANGLRSSLIVAGREYRIPKRGGISAPGRASVPERRLPPTPPRAP